MSSFLTNLLPKSDIMKKRKGSKILILTYFSTFLFIFFLTSSMADVLNNSKDVSSKEIINYENNLKNLKNSGYWPLPNISINDLAWNNWVWAATKDWCSGTGTLGDPYIIENVTIKNSMEGIKIRDSIKYFVVRNVTIYNVTISGIKLNNVTNGVFFDNNISSNILWGMYLSDSNYNLIKENFIFNNSEDGILLKMLSNNNTIKKNIIKNSTGMGISITTQSNNNTISENIVNNGLYDGIYLHSSVNNAVLRNNVTNNSGDGIFISTGSSGTTVRENILNLNNQGINLIGNVNTTIKDNIIKNSTYTGIYLDNCNSSIVLGNTVNDNTDSGIYLTYSSYNNITSNSVSGNNDGIYLEDESYYNLISGNIMDGNNQGLNLYYVDFNSIIENTANDNAYNGITIEGGNNNNFSGNNANNNIDYGIYLYYANNNTIIGNTVRDNYMSGIYFEEDSDYQEITENIIYNNTIGISIESLNYNNSVYKNIFLKNGKHAFDDGIDNKWNSTTIGNYWDNHTGPDTTPNDGIVDVQYNISGPAGSIDYLPIADDGTPQVIINFPSGGDAFGSTAPSFDVTITDNYLDSMWYSIDGGLNNYTSTANGIIEQTVWGPISDGNLTFTFYARDIFENIGSADVIIEKDTQAPIITINSPYTGEIFGNDAPFFNVTVTDPNLDSVWLELDGSNYELSIPIIGAINQTVWAALPEGSYTITLHANDTLGHSTSEAVTITKSVPSGGGIGLDYFMTSFLIFITGGMAVIVVLVKNYTKKSIKFS
ncbi:MAG: hypothetical protein Lokiarch_03580 [Candidatus Lokiarchaeum sp. GC14_75]|nr:MAG: hypothetical protein Lokiarch_03580 [Candidatus Lokiarchaeum sp. GC14_75]